MIRCCFAGHRFAPHSLLPEVLLAVGEIVRESDSVEFYSGGMGDFDKLCEQAVREIKKGFPEKEILLSLVLPSCQYVPENRYLTYLSRLYDEIFVCEASDGAHYKSMIGKRNRWMIENSDILIAYVTHDGGGACAALKYAQKRNLRIIRVGVCPDGS